MTSRNQILDRIRAGTGAALKGTGFGGKGTGFSGKGTGFSGKGTGFGGKGTGFSGKGTGFSGKGTGFSPYISSAQTDGALAPEGQGHPDLQRTYIRRGSLATSARIALMIERLREYDAEVTECAPADLAACIADRLRLSGRLTFAAPPGLPAAWLAPGFDWKIDHNLSHEQIEHCDGVVTAAFAAVADSGTIVLHHSASEGRRVLTLLPDWHLCILRAGQIVETLPEYFDRCPQPPTLVTYISGPSATADIEMTRIKGVHGPRFLNVLLVHDETESTSVTP